MGSTAVIDTIKGRNPREAFEDAQQSARYEHGSSYTGSIAEARGFIERPAMPRYEAERRAQRALDTDEVSKWGPCVLIPVVPIPEPRTVRLTMNITGLDHEGVEEAVDREVRARLMKGEAVESVRRSDSGRTYSDMPRGERRTRAVATKGTGALVEEYVVRDSGKHVVATLPTLAEAEEWAMARVEKSWGAPFTVELRTRRESGPLLTVSVEVLEETCVVEAKVGVPKGTPTEFVCAGWYSC
jgi:hypothetical protein